jgi:phosphate binding protein
MNAHFYRQAVLLAAVTGLAGCTGGADSTTTTGGGGGGEPAVAPYLPEGAVLPTPESIETFAYTPLSRPLFLYVNKKSLSKPELVAYLRYYLSDEGQALVSEAGYVRLNSAELGTTRSALEQAVKDAGTGEIPAGLSGEVSIDGSSTVAPVSVAVAEEFSKKHSRVRVPVATSGTGGGFKRFLRGEIDINDASRAIQDSEVALAKEQNIEYLELKIAIDGLTVVVNPENDWCDGMTIADLKKIWEPGSTVKAWSDVRPEWPSESITLFGPDTDSGTFDYFTEEVCGEAKASRPDYQQNADDNFLVTGVAGDKYALGYFGYAYYVENQDAVKALAIAP